MNILELKNKCDEIIKDGGGESEVVFDTEAGAFDVHLVRIKEIYFDIQANEASGGNFTIMHCDGKNINHYWIEKGKENENK